MKAQLLEKLAGRFRVLPGATASFSFDWKAPDDAQVIEYDRRHLASYAALLDLADEGRDWREAASIILGLDVSEAGAEECWRSHLQRARWIIGKGLDQAIEAFGRRPSDQ